MKPTRKFTVLIERDEQGYYVASVPALVIAGCIEAFISPSHFPVWFKIVLGLMLGSVFWAYLLLTGKKVPVAI